MDLAALAPQECGPADLTLDDARSLAQQLARGALPYARPLGCRHGPEAEVVLLEAEVELAQHRLHDIRSVEPIAVVFWLRESLNRTGPEVLALRADFPASVPHLNLRVWDYPKSLCLYEVPFRDVRAQLTPARFVARVREWLRLTARGELHAGDQPLEPLLGDGKGWVVLPHAIRTDDPKVTAAISDAAAGTGSFASLPIMFTCRPAHRGLPVLVAALPGEDEGEELVAAVATIVRIGPRAHGAIRRAPTTLEELHQMLAEGGDDLLGSLRGSLLQWNRPKHVLEAHLMLVVLIPKQRTPGGGVENIETWVILTNRTVRDLGIAIGIWELDGSGRPGVLLQPDTSRRGADVRVELAYPFFTVSRADAARYNGRPGAEDTHIVAIGGGSLGSQVFMNAVRAAFGRWTIIDDDLLLPHNLARHALPPEAIALPKATCLATLGNRLVPDEPFARGIVADVLDPGDQAEAVASALRGATTIVDFSASVTVARALAQDVDSAARRISIYLNPSGTDLTLLAEDSGRTTSLDALEMQYYRALVRHDALQGALLQPPATIRYGRSCRDVSVEMPQALAGLHAGIATWGLEEAMVSPASRLRVWRVSVANLGVSALEITPAPVNTCRLGEWSLVTDAWLLERLAALRAAKLPNETGGVLVGTFDLSRRIVYVVDTVPSPPDSQEWPMLYIRGCVGLEDEVRRIGEITAGQLHYIGEWHSHPAEHSCLPSGDDLTVFTWLTEVMDHDGLPALMMIVGDGGLAVPYLGRMARDGTYPGTLQPSPPAAT